MEQSFWRTCIVCKKHINYSVLYFKCSVDSCDKKRSPAQFCSVSCWDVHRSIMSHKSAGADEYQSPTKEQWESEVNSSPKVRIITKQPSKTSSLSSTHLDSNVNTDDILVVVSKLKSFIKESSDMNTSSDVMPILSNIIRSTCLQAIKSAEDDSRKTVMARDF